MYSGWSCLPSQATEIHGGKGSAMPDPNDPLHPPLAGWVYVLISSPKTLEILERVRKVTVSGCSCSKPHGILEPTRESEKLREREWGNPWGTHICLTIINPIWARAWAVQGLWCQPCSAACPGCSKSGQSQGSSTQSYLMGHCGQPLGLVHRASIHLSGLGGSSYRHRGQTSSAAT